MKDSIWTLPFALLLSVLFFLSGLFSWFTPLPLFYIARRYSLARAAFAWGLVFLILVGFYELFFFWMFQNGMAPNWLHWVSWLPGMAYYAVFGKKVVLSSIWVYLTFFASLSLMLAWRTRLEKSLIRLVIWVLLGTFLCTFLLITILIRGDFHALLQGGFHYLHTVLDQFVTLNKATGLQGDEIAFIEKNKVWIATSFLKVIPGFLFVVGVFLIAFNLGMARKIFAAFGFFPQLEDFSVIHLPFWMVWFFIAVLSFFLMNTSVLHQDFLNEFFINLFLVFLVSYFFQGVSITRFYLNKKQIGPGFRFFLYALVFIFLQPLGFLIVGLGFFDSWFNFRRLKIQPTV